MNAALQKELLDLVQDYADAPNPTERGKIEIQMVDFIHGLLANALLKKTVEKIHIAICEQSLEECSEYESGRCWKAAKITITM